MKIFKKPIFVLISPNAQIGDVFLALRLIFTPWRWRKGSKIMKFSEALGNYLGIKFVYTFDSGRHSLCSILQSLNLTEKHEVLIQAFTCTAVVNPILWLSAKPIYVDIEEDNYNMSPVDLKKKITPKSRALIIQHTFGIPAKLDEILAIAKDHNLLVIEDIAHALGAEYLPAQISGGKIVAGRSRKVGTFGDAAFMSFGRFKIISAVFAGAAGTNNPEIAKDIEAFYKISPYPSRLWTLRELLHPVTFAILKPIYNIFDIGKIAAAILRKLKFIAPTVSPSEKTGGHPNFGPAKMPNALASLGLNQLKKIEKFNNHRRSLAEIYKKEFALVNKVKTPQVLPNSNPVFLYFPIQVQDAGLLDSIIKAGKKEGIYLENWPAKQVVGPPDADLNELQYKIGSCPMAEEAAKRVIILPTSPNTTENDARRVAEFIKNTINRLEEFNKVAQVVDGLSLK